MILVALALAVQLPTQNFPAVDHPGADPLLAADIRAACPSNGADDRATLLRLERQQADTKILGQDARAWTALGCTRARLSLNGALSHEGELMIAGDSWAQGAIKALIKALSIRPGDAHVADLLAVLAMNEPEPRNLTDIALALDRAVAAGVAGNATLRGCSDFGFRAGRPDVTRRCAARALAGGKDSTWHSLLLARLAFRDADSVAGSLAFVRAAGAAHDTLAKLAIGWHLQWFVSPEERKAWSSLADGTRDRWVRDLLAMRDVRDGRPAGARLAEHFKRLEHADSAFRLSVAGLMRTAMLSAPSTPMASSSSGAGFAPPGIQQVATGNVSLLSESSFRDYQRWQVDWDDRGVVWMRFGAPEKSFYLRDHEVWYYEIDGKPLLLTFGYEQFSGSSAPSRLLTGFIGDIFCGIDAFRCGLSMRQTLNPEMARQVKDQDREYVSAATTNDDNSVRTDRTIDLVSRMHRLWDPISGMPVALLTYAIKAGDLVTPADSAQRTARVEFDFRRWDATQNHWQDTAFTRRFTFSANGIRSLTGFLVTPSSPTVSSWSLVATQSENRRGRAWDLTTGPLDTGPVALSDLVLGQAGQGGLIWSYHNVDILLAPLNSADRHQPVSLYYQIRSSEAREGLRTTVALYPVNGAVVSDTAVLQVGFEQVVRSGVNEVAPTLDVSHLDKGSYRLEVRLTDARGAVITRRTVRLNLE